MMTNDSTITSALQSSVLALLGTVLLLQSCAPEIVSAPEKLPPYSELATRCAKWMDGSFSNKAQVKTDSSIAAAWLHQVRIWPDRTDGIWFYVEETRDGNTQTPFQQYVLKLTDDLGGGLLLQRYGLPGDSARFAGSWRTPRDFNRVDPFTLSLKGGCAMRLLRQGDGSLSGGTKGTSCATKMHGAAYMTVEMRVGSIQVSQWTRGYDAYGKLVFGSSKGPMLFDRTKATSSPESTRPGSGHIPDIGPYTPKAD